MGGEAVQRLAERAGRFDDTGKVSPGNLLAGLQTVQNVVSTRTTLPILSNVLLHAADGQLRLTTTDLDVGVSA